MKTQNEVQQATELKIWNRSITIEVDLDIIAHKLRETFNETYPHSNLLTNTIIGIAREDGRLGNIYSALSGHDIQIDFKVGQKVSTTTKSYYSANGEREEIGNCIVAEVNPYRRDCRVKVTWEANNKSHNDWVSINSLSEPIIVNEEIGYGPKVVGKIDMNQMV
jgi:hypothetical protein